MGRWARACPVRRERRWRQEGSAGFARAPPKRTHTISYTLKPRRSPCLTAQAPSDRNLIETYNRLCQSCEELPHGTAQKPRGKPSFPAGNCNRITDHTMIFGPLRRHALAASLFLSCLLPSLPAQELLSDNGFELSTP